MSPRAGAHLTVLLPVRNGESILPGWLDDVAGFADSVIALDDGSTDRTRSILDSHPLVTRTLTNPVRPTFHGWDDLGNRQRLVYAALADGARWMLFLDADERIDGDDASALRRFLETEAQPGFAYGFEVFRMVEDFDHVDPRAFWVFRLFHAADATSPLGSTRLHFVPVPSGIERRHWLYTTVRIQHAGSLTAAHRAARFAKYREADPDNEHQGDYTTLLGDPDVVVPWSPRRDGLPVLVGLQGRYVDRLAEHASTWPAITAVVIAQDDEDVIDRSLDALESQALDDEFEIVVVCSGSDGTERRVRERHPSARVVQLPERALPGEARNAGLWMAGGEYVTFPGSHVWLCPGSLAARLAAHDDGWDLVTASVVNGNPTRAGWASYFLDHVAQVPSRASGPFEGVPGHASYVTADVRGLGGFPEDVRTAEDTVVNRQLFNAGKRTYFAADASFAHASPSTNVVHLLHHHAQRGRGLGRMIRGARHRATFAQVRSSLGLPRRRMRYIASALEHADDQTREQYRHVRRLVAAGAFAAGAGTWFELVRRNRNGPEASRSIQTREQGPLLVLSGRPGEAPTGLLAAGTAPRAIVRIGTFARYARTVCEVRPAIAPIVTSATVTAEYGGTHTIDLPEPVVDTYVDAAGTAGVIALLQIQPGWASLLDLVERWKRYLVDPHVGLYLDLRDEVAFGDQPAQLDDAVRLARELAGRDVIVVIRGAEGADEPVLVAADVIDLRRRGSAYPHDVLAAAPGTDVLVYE